ETLARLKHRRDVTLPYVLNRLRHQEAMLLQYAERGPEQARQAAKDLYPVANARKALVGQYQGLLDPAIVQRKAADEADLKRRVQPQPARFKAAAESWNHIARAQAALAHFEKEYSLLESGLGTTKETGDAFDSRLFRIARHLVRLAEEKAKPDADR